LKKNIPFLKIFGCIIRPVEHINAENDLEFSDQSHSEGEDQEKDHEKE